MANRCHREFELYRQEKLLMAHNGVEGCLYLSHVHSASRYLYINFQIYASDCAKKILCTKYSRCTFFQNYYYIVDYRHREKK